MQKNKKEKFAFILGCERSGSTWLSNICDAHPATEFFMEPFADYAHIFPGFPHRNVYISGENRILSDSVRAGYRSLLDRKYPYFYSRDGSRFSKKLDNMLVSALDKVAGFGVPDLSRKLDQYKLLHLNHAVDSGIFNCDKNNRIDLFVTKELRLNFKLRLIEQTYPDSKYVIIVRNPRAQLSSILSHFEKGHLGELKKSLRSFREDVISSARFAEYHHAFKSLQNDDLVGLLVAWWIVNYGTLIEDCKHLNLDHLLVFHEHLSQKPWEVVTEILDFLELDMPNSVRNYINISTSGRKILKGPLDTFRDSKHFYEVAINNAREDVTSKVRDAGVNFETISELDPYFHDVDDLPL